MYQSALIAQKPVNPHRLFDTKARDLECHCVFGHFQLYKSHLFIKHISPLSQIVSGGKTAHVFDCCEWGPSEFGSLCGFEDCGFCVVFGHAEFFFFLQCVMNPTQQCVNWNGKWQIHYGIIFLPKKPILPLACTLLYGPAGRTARPPTIHQFLLIFFPKIIWPKWAPVLLRSAGRLGICSFSGVMLWAKPRKYSEFNALKKVSCSPRLHLFD